MKFMHPNGARLTLLSGHITRLPPGEWVELDPIYHQAAIEKGCHMDSRVIGARVEAPLTRGPAASTVHDERELTRKAIQIMLDREEEGDFTAASLPNANVVASITGMRPNKQMVGEVFAELKEIAKQEAEEAALAEKAAAARAAANQ